MRESENGWTVVRQVNGVEILVAQVFRGELSTLFAMTIATRAAEAFGADSLTVIDAGATETVIGFNRKNGKTLIN